MYKQAQAALHSYVMEKQALEKQAIEGFRIINALASRISKLKQIPGAEAQVKALQDRLAKLEKMDMTSAGKPGNINSMSPRHRAVIDEAIKGTRADELTAAKAYVGAAKDDAGRKGALETVKGLFGNKVKPEFARGGADDVMGHMQRMSNKQPLLAGMDPVKRRWLNRGAMIGGGALGGGIAGAALAGNSNPPPDQY